MNIKNNHKPGHIYRTRSQRWGMSDLLCIKVPAYDTPCFLNLKYPSSPCYYLSVCGDEEIVEEWTKLEDYQRFIDKE